MNANDHLIAKLFDNLDAWRHFPAYQLERRADIFFSLYLREVVEGERRIRLASAMIPELPLKNADSARSTKADYFLLSEDRARAFIVELKTDALSRDAEQDARLEMAARDGIASLVEGILQVAIRTHASGKYLRLLRALEALGLVNLPTDLEDWVHRDRRIGLTAKLREITLTALRPRVEVLYILPRPCDTVSCISFEAFARSVARYPDPISQRFPQSLLTWQGVAGARASPR